MRVSCPRFALFGWLVFVCLFIVVLCLFVVVAVVGDWVFWEGGAWGGGGGGGEG